MSGHSSEQWLLVFTTTLVVVVRVFMLIRWIWNYPLAHGTGFFLGVEVSPGFYEGEGRRWLKRYRTVLLAEHSIEGLAWIVILASGRWSQLPATAFGAVLCTATWLGFLAYTRATLGAHPPVLSNVAIPLESRRLGDYISWPVEALVAVIIAFSWLLLLTQGDAQVRWQTLVFTYVAVGLLPGKISVVRSSFPLPSERTEEHHRWLEASRRHGVRVMDAFGWFFVAILVGYALQHGWPAAKTMVWLRWLLVGVALAIWLIMTVVIIRGWGRVAAMGRDLRPIGSWSGPFRPARLMMPGYLTWFTVWFGGLVLLMVFFRR